MDYKLLAEARFYFAQCVFNTSCHYSAFERYKRERSKRQVIALLLSGLTVLILVLTIIGWEWQCNAFLRLLSFIGLLSTASSLMFEFYNREDLTEFMCSHKTTAESYKALRDSFMNLIRQIISEDDSILKASLLEKYLDEYKLIGRHSPTTNSDDYAKAQSALGLKNKGETFTWSNEEIDRFLPEELRIKSIYKA